MLNMWFIHCTCPMSISNTYHHLQHFHLLASTWNTGLFQCLRVTNAGLTEFTPGHAPSVQLVATLMMTSPPVAAIGPETLYTGPIAYWCGDVSPEQPVQFHCAGRGLAAANVIVSCRKRSDWMRALKVSVCCWEKRVRTRAVSERH